ncbi:PocR ligand-binding domain-containing protein [Tessaracoccus sp. OH4464_COT-324]|uniref:PocR ligand-binding domain-containing protein n=1 Tax=Tessaracoccus sp. OH4464_COT-324 TaxID=2491059 RepID=UPI000F639A25|nr:PocR ligand-binding domain-containing protein [Tessaracoccus sp. OH4464_COT-324]RRD47809.1 helix-turn-helix domain-containing protein [Tessaracoccus sp. OH4464_COT-324]
MQHVDLSGFDPGLLDLRRLIDIEKLQAIQEEFARDTGLAMITVDAMGTPVTEASQFTQLCEFLRRDPEIRKRCYSCDAHGGFQAALEGRPFIYRCHAGLVDFSVSIMAGKHFLGAIMAGQVMLQKGMDQLDRIISISSGLSDDEVGELYDGIRVVELAKLESAAQRIISMANDALGKQQAYFDFSATAGTYLGRVQPYPAEGTGRLLAPIVASRAKEAPLIPIVPSPVEAEAELNPTEWAQNLRRRNVAANLELLNDFLDTVMPRWSLKIPVSVLGPLEDMLIGIASSEGVRYGKEISQSVITQRKKRTAPLNRYAAQVYCERLLIQLHDLIEPELPPGERSIATLLNEIEKEPTAFLTCAKAAEFLMWSESHFSRQFRKHTGYSFNQYVTRKRIERGKFLLVHTDKPVLRIAAHLKFQPLNYFSRAFKREEGVTPSEYRDSHRTEE